jgi:fatty acid desaturase
LNIFLSCSDSEVVTSVDYGHENGLWAFLSGALNYQTIHHLFPGVSQYHYPAIAPIVKEVCKKWRVPYNHIDGGLVPAVKMHVQYLREMGNQTTRKPHPYSH